MTDSSKLQYYTGYNAYKNLGVYPGTISVTTASVAAGTIRNWETTISVEPDSRFAFARIEANEDGPTALRWKTFPSAVSAWQTLSVDPVGAGTHSLSLQMLVNNNQITFRAQTFNPYAGALAFNALDIDFVYSAHTVNI